MIRVTLRPMQEILAARRLTGEASLFLANEVGRTCDPYVPMQTGMLKSVKRITPVQTGAQLVYTMPYAKQQYYSGRTEGQSRTGALRGRMWFERAKAAHGTGWIKSTAQYIGGRIT